MEQQSVWNLIREDLEAYEKFGKKGFFKAFLKQYFKSPGFKVIFFMRLCKATSGYKHLKLLYLLLRLKFRQVQVRYGIQLDYRTNIAGGFSIMHYSGIVISVEKIGRHVQLRQGTTIGNTERGKPIIGDNVFIGANATIIGNITIGNNCMIGAGSVVTKTFQDNSIIAGNPAKVIGYNTSLLDF